jgi:hypothetical protein
MKQIRIRKSRRIKMRGYRAEGIVKKEEEILKDFKEELRIELDKMDSA